ncbi:L-aspartate oxidase [Nocardiopsis sp. RSe5-2]|uniref:L-aspartate oxidase n=1 Tax=Nocardiopsis endophytica TaxID=3018445 RepID=A0ABT4U1I4_9ACTN|nr:L-aspartate oxidase [Nocardiopsis endophytica]MDA2810809.1 L-aspartate oxidase [Nocardiopsis endophytica]
MTTAPPPGRLAAPDPGWTVEADAVIIGSGVAGLSTALEYVRRAPGARAVLVTKDVLDSGSTRWAQGGIAAAVGPGDDPVAHMADTLEAGAGMCDPLAVHVLAAEGPAALERLVAAGTAFDRDADGGLQLTREGGHRADRIAHAGGDATGAEIVRALVAAVRAEPRIEVVEHALALDALPGTAPGGGPAVRGVTLHVMGEGERDGVGAVLAPAVVLAAGGLGQVFASTTNPEVSTGDGAALAARAGAPLADLEFVQFHPTVLWTGAGARGRRPLVSEAVRGEGAFLTDVHGRRIMEGVHELGDLAPRDVVADTAARAMAATGADHVLLDARAFGAAMWERRFPTILAACREHGIDPVTEPIPVAPAAHYASGGVETGADGRTAVHGLYAVGENARTGVHGANRLASNSLLEGAVFAERIAAGLAGDPPAPAAPAAPPVGAPAALADPGGLEELRTLMSRHAGVLRDAEGLERIAEHAASMFARGAAAPPRPGVEAWEATNLATVAVLVARAALERRESRGAHRRSDHPAPDPRLRGRPVRLALAADGVSARLEERPADAALPPGLRAELEGIGAPIARDTGSAGPGQRPELVLPWRTSAEAHVRTVLTALAEDLTHGARIDVTTAATVPAAQVSTADVVARAEGTVAGLPLAELAFWLAAEGAVRVERRASDGQRAARGDVLMTVTGRTRDLLTAERTALNLLTHLSGIATTTRAWSDAVAGTGARVRDSRKTLPGLRALEKYAVRCGGGENHRMALSDAALIKDNHVVAAGGVEAAVHAVRTAFPGVPLEVEVDRMDQIEPALKAGAEEILLDNFAPDRLRAAVALVAGRARLEASGGLTLDSAAEVAATGVDLLAVGALTHSSPALDIALDLRPV